MLIEENDSQIKYSRNLNMKKKKLFKIVKKIAKVINNQEIAIHIFYEKEKEESESDNDQSILSVEKSIAESKYDDHRACLNSRRDEIKELKMK